MTTYDEALEAYTYNADYDQAGDVAKAQALIVACRRLIALTPKRAAHGGRGTEEVEFELDQYRQQLEAAQRFVAANSSRGLCGTYRTTVFDR